MLWLQFYTRSLVTLKCSITNHVVKYGYVVLATLALMLLEKILLSGMNFFQEYMDVIPMRSVVQSKEVFQDFSFF